MFGGIILRLYLRPIQEDDGKLIVKWHNSPIVLDRCLNKGLITEESNSLFFKKYILNLYMKIVCFFLRINNICNFHI